MTDYEAAVLAELRAIRRLLEPRGSSQHAPLVRAIAAVAYGVSFSATEIVTHAEVEGELRTALLASCGVNAKKLGRLLRRIEGTEVAGHVIERHGEDSAGVIWAVKVVKPLLQIA